MEEVYEMIAVYTTVSFCARTYNLRLFISNSNKIDMEVLWMFLQQESGSNQQ